MMSLKTEPHLIDLLDRPIAFHRVFADLTGSIPAALLLSQALYWQRRCPGGRDGWWWKTADEWFEEARLTRREQQSARKILVRLGVLEEIKKGVPCRLWFRLDLNKLLVLIQSAAPRQTGTTVRPVCRNAVGKFVTLRQPSVPKKRQTITEITTETPSKINPKPACGGNMLKQSKIEGLEYYQNMFGIEFPASVLNLDAPNRIAAIIIKEKLNSEEIRKVFAEFSSSKNKGDVHDPRALFVSLVKKAKTSELNLSVGGEKCLPQWL